MSAPDGKKRITRLACLSLIFLILEKIFQYYPGNIRGRIDVSHSTPGGDTRYTEGIQIKNYCSVSKKSHFREAKKGVTI